MIKPGAKWHSAVLSPPPSTSISEVNFRGGNDRARRETGKDAGKEKRGKGERGIGKERREKVTKIRGAGVKKKVI